MAALWAWKPADLLLYAVPVFENHHQVWSRPKQAETGVSGYGLDWKRAVWACFPENDHIHAQNWIYKFGHWPRFTVQPKAGGPDYDRLYKVREFISNIAANFKD